MRVPWTARRSNPSILKEINLDYSLEGLMLKLQHQYLGHLIRDDSLEKTLMLGKTEEVGLRLNIQKMNIMVSGPIISWEIDGETVETVSDFIVLGSKITAYGDCSHEIKRHLFLGRKVMTNLDHILKSRDFTLPTKVHLVKAMICPVVIYVCEIWTIKKAKH